MGTCAVNMDKSIFLQWKLSVNLELAPDLGTALRLRIRLKFSNKSCSNMKIGRSVAIVNTGAGEQAAGAADVDDCLFCRSK